MAVAAIVSLGALDAGWVLAPERYDPRRRGDGRPGVALGSLAEVAGLTVTAAKAGTARLVVLDTGDAREGVVTAKAAVPAAELGSAKKLLRPGDVIVSRLRPYLRQVALVDAELAGPGVGLACSTEFFVLRPAGGGGGESIAFLVAFLLGDGAQSALAACVEGGHHPRVGQAALEQLVVPADVLARRDELSARVEAAVAAARRGERELAAAIALAGDESHRLAA